jgi:FtsZ-binding cell division protein ZapB
LIIAHATTSTNTKILVPEGSVDMKDFEQRWAQPGVAIPYDPTDGAPMPVQPTPLANELYQNETTAKADIDHALGLYEMMMGNTQAAPDTYKATISLDEFGQRKMKSKLADVEAALVRIGQLAIPLMQQLHKTEKVFRVLQPNNSLSEYVVNKKLVDDKTGVIKIFNDITVGKYDVIVVSGSTLPSNRYAELEFYMDAYTKGLIDKQEVLKKTEIFDMEGVLQRTDTIAQLQSQLEQVNEENKKLKGDLQTRDREAVNLRKKAEVEKFKADMDQVGNKAKAAGTLYEKRLDDSLSTIKKGISDAIKNSSPPSSGKGAAQRRKK